MYLARAETYEQVRERFEWRIPDDYNIARACCDDWAERDPGRVALRQWRPGEASIDIGYNELADQSRRLASALAGLGLAAGDRVAIILPQSVEAVAAHLAIYRSAMIATPLARLFAPDAIEYRMRRAGCAAAITNRSGLEKIRSVRAALPDLRFVIVTDDEEAKDAISYRRLLASPDFVDRPTTPDTPALIIFTSGTTGQPKGALHGHRVVPGHVPCLQFHHEFMPQPGDLMWTPADWAWAGGLLNALLPSLQMGVPVVFGGLDRFDPELAFRLMAETGVRNAFIPPTALRLMKTVDRPGGRYALKLRTIGSAGESLGRDAYEWARRELGVSVNEFYGQTECNTVLSACALIGVTKAGSTGRPAPGHTVAALKADGTPCAPGETGEIAVRRPDPVMFLGYWQDEEATAAKFSGDWMMTGDQCYVDDEGYFHFVGRDDDIINSAGYRVGPGEIEDCLASHPAVRLSAAVAKPDPLRTEIVKAYVALRPGFEPGEPLREEIRLHVKARLAENIYPREIEFVDDVPLTTTGKVIRRHFRERARAEAASGG